MSSVISNEQYERLVNKFKLSTEQRIRLEHEYNALVNKFNNYQALQEKVMLVLQHKNQSEIEAYQAKCKQMEELLQFHMKHTTNGSSDPDGNNQNTPPQELDVLNQLVQ
eukprot:UN07884